MNETDKKLMMALQRGQQCFVLCSATMPGNTIIFASEGFLELTGYSLDQVLGRPALFLTVSQHSHTYTHTRELAVGHPLRLTCHAPRRCLDPIIGCGLIVCRGSHMTC